MTMQVAVIGGGRWGKNLIRTFHELGALTAVAEQNKTLRAGLQETYSDIDILESHEAILSSDIPAVAIATPVSTHFTLAKAALDAGKHVFVEKPITETPEEAQQLCQLAQEKGLTLMVGHLLLYQPAIQFIKQFLSSGQLGKVFAYHQTRRNLGTIRTHENVLYSLGVHDLAVLDYLVGEAPNHIQSNGQAITNTAIEDEMSVHLTYPSGVQAHLTLSWLWPHKERRLVILGEKGALYFDELTAKVTWMKSHGNADATITQDGEEVVFEGSAQPLSLELQHFLDCAQHRITPNSPGAQGVRVAEIMTAITAQKVNTLETV